ncbi:MAG: ATPase [Proteobacteria bacterium]|nr:ATPase [Pseudomonadota bacterium]
MPTKGSQREKGAQIDLLFDRADGVINLCEMKYSQEVCTISKAYSRELKQKIAVFEEQTKTKKDIHLTLVVTHGLKSNVWSEDLVDSIVTVNDLFSPA